MSFLTKNALNTFDFSQSTLYKITFLSEHVTVELQDVIILDTNSENTAFRKMGTNDLTLELLKVSNIEFVKDGYTIRDMNGNIRESEEDTLIPEEEYKRLVKLFQGYAVAGIEKNDNVYKFYFDTDDDLISYTLKITAEADQEEWERFRNIPDELR